MSHISKPRPGDIVEVDWIDAGGQSGWHEASQSARGLEESAARSVGYLVEDSERGVAIVMGYSQTGNQHDSSTFPRPMVVEVRRLMEASA